MSLADMSGLGDELWSVHGPRIMRNFDALEDGRLRNSICFEEWDKARVVFEGGRNGIAGAKGKWGEIKSTGAAASSLRSKRLAEARRKATHTNEQWHALVSFCGHTCLRCGIECLKPVKDHITPIYQEGSDGIENIQPLCQKCNCSKGPESKDYRPDGWRNALNVCITPTGADIMQTFNVSERLQTSATYTGTETEELSEAKASSPRRDADGGESPRPDEFIYGEYPRKEGHGAAIKAIGRAVDRIRKGEGVIPPMELREARIYLYRRVQCYARSPAGSRADKTLVPHPATWFNQSRYLDDESNWQLTGGQGNGGFGTHQPSAAKQRIDGARLKLAEIAVKRGLIDPFGGSGDVDSPLPFAGSRGEHSGIFSGSRTVGAEVLRPEGAERTGGTADRAGPEVLSPAR